MDLLAQFEILLEQSIGVLPQKKIILQKLFPLLSLEEKKSIIEILETEQKNIKKIIVQADKKMIEKIKNIKIKKTQEKSKHLQEEHQTIEQKEKQNIDNLLNEL